jgi:hypothetical protein
MKNERTISYKLSKEISKEELESISAAGSTFKGTFQTTYTASGSDTCYDYETDIV